MSDQLKVTITKIDASVATYPVLPKTIVAFERHFGVGIGILSAGQTRMEHVYWLAWDAEHSSGNVVKPFDDWLGDIANVEAEDDASPLAVGASPAS